MNMKKILRFVIPAVVLLGLALLYYSQGQSQVPEKMTSEKWVDDLNHLNKEIQKTFATFDPSLKGNFNREVETLSQRIPNLKDHEIKIELMRIVSTLKDGHTEINVGQKNGGFHRMPLIFYFFNSELYVVNSHEDYRAFLGAKVVKFGERRTVEVFNKLKTILSHDNDMEFLHAGPGYLVLTEVLNYLGITDSLMSCTLTMEVGDSILQTVTFNGIMQEEYSKGPWLSLLKENKVTVPLYLKDTQKYYWYEYLPKEETMYFNLGRLNNQDGEVSIKKFTAQLFDVIDKEKPRRFVIDMRNNNGGNYHLSEKLVEEIKSRPWLDQPGKVWAISGRRTFSAASVACIFLKQQTNTTLIGECGRTHPNQCDNNEYMTLPHSKLLLEYTTIVKKHWPELRDADRIPIDVAIDVGIDQYRRGIDPVMEYILSK